MEGSGKVLITAVGINSQAGTIMKLMGVTNSEKTKTDDKKKSAANSNGTASNGHCAGGDRYIVVKSSFNCIGSQY